MNDYPINLMPEPVPLSLNSIGEVSSLEVHLGDAYSFQITSIPVTSKSITLSVKWDGIVEKKLIMLFGSRALAMDERCRMNSYRCAKQGNARRASYWMNQTKKWHTRILLESSSW